MGKGWTEERRQKQSDAIKRWKPWKKSTGPKTAEGKQRASLNALIHGARSLAPDIRAASDALAHQRKFVKLIMYAFAVSSAPRWEGMTNGLLRKGNLSQLNQTDGGSE